MPFWFLEAKGVSSLKGKFPCHLQFGICILHLPEEGIGSYWNGDFMVDFDDQTQPEYPKLYANAAGIKRGLQAVGARVPKGILCYAWWQASEDLGHTVRPVKKYLDMENLVPGCPRGLSRS